MLPKISNKRKIALSLLIAFLSSFLFPQLVLAFSTPWQNYPQDFEEAVFKTEEMNLQSFVFEVTKALIMSLCELGIGCLTCTPRQRGFGAAGTMSALIAFSYSHPPASGVEYLARLGQELNFIQPVYAQETGFHKMEVFLPIWKAFRDITYVLFALLFVLIGFAIMFRIKISPQAVITIQAALPKIILALLLVTFSYAIVGFLVDIFWVFNNLIIFTFGKLFAEKGAIADFFQKLLGLSGEPTTSESAIALKIFFAGLIPILVAAIMLLIVGSIGSLLGAAVTGGAAVPILAVVDFLILAIVVVVFLVALIKTVWTLLKAYIGIIFGLIFAPFQLLMGALPASNATSRWLTSLLANLAVLPTVLTMVLLSCYLTLISVEKFVSGFLIQIGNFLVGTTTLGILQNAFGKPEGVGTMFIFLFVSIGILLMASRAADIIKSFITGEPFTYGTAIGQALGPAVVIGGLPVSGAKWQLGKWATGGKAVGPPWLQWIQRRLGEAAVQRGWYKP